MRGVTISSVNNLPQYRKRTRGPDYPFEKTSRALMNHDSVRGKAQGMSGEEKTKLRSFVEIGVPRSDHHYKAHAVDGFDQSERDFIDFRLGEEEKKCQGRGSAVREPEWN